MGGISSHGQPLRHIILPTRADYRRVVDFINMHDSYTSHAMISRMQFIGRGSRRRGSQSQQARLVEHYFKRAFLRRFDAMPDYCKYHERHARRRCLSMSPAVSFILAFQCL